MKTTSAMLVASALSLASMFALADDRTPSDVIPAEQAKEADWIKAALVKMWSRTPPANAKKEAAKAKMTPEQKAAANQTMNTPEADKILREQKGQ
jgi:hypothetical protein